MSSRGAGIISHPQVLEDICKYGFGVVLEVSNGITNLSKRQEKKRQVVAASKTLQNLVDEDARE